MSNSIDERSPLLQFPGSLTPRDVEELPDAYQQFCHLIGNRPSDHPADKSFYPPRDTLYYRALQHRKSQGRMYVFTSALTNTLLMSQVVLGAALTGLAASEHSSRVLITVLGAMNTIIAGLIAFLKSRGQPMRSRMFRDDLDRVVDEIENSAVMWKGISQKIHGYDAIDTDEAVTVRSEVARLTRLYDRAVKTSTMNDPDFYGAGVAADLATAGLRNRAGQPLVHVAPSSQVPAVPAPGNSATGPGAADAGPSIDLDESPATKAPAPTPPKPAEESQTSPAEARLADDNSEQPAETSTTPATTPAPTPSAAVAHVSDPDASPATAPRPPPSESSKSKRTIKVTEDLSAPPGPS